MLQDTECNAIAAYSTSERTTLVPSALESVEDANRVYGGSEMQVGEVWGASLETMVNFGLAGVGGLVHASNEGKCMAHLSVLQNEPIKKATTTLVRLNQNGRVTYGFVARP